MTIKEILDNYVNHNLDNLKFLKDSITDYEDSDKKILLFINKLKQTQYNPAFGINFIDLLQLSNDKTIFNQYDFEDIRNLFESLIKLEEYNLDVYVEYAHFEWTIMDNKNKAIELITIGMEKSKQKMDELERLRNSIDND